MNLKYNKILIITLYSGESEFDKCMCAIKSQQTDCYVAVHVIRNKGNVEAHHALYTKIMDETNNFDFFVKLDADMVLQNRGSLQAVLALIAQSDADILSIPVYDYITNTMIWGLNVYRSGLIWELDEELFTDQQHLKSKCNFKRVKLERSESLVTHCPDPSDYQAYAFGVHRASKVLQKSKKDYLLGHALGQINIIFSIFKEVKKGGDKKRVYALIGAFHIFTGMLDELLFEDKNHFWKKFQDIDFLTEKNNAILFFELGRFFVLFSSISKFRLSKGLLIYLKRKSSIFLKILNK